MKKETKHGGGEVYVSLAKEPENGLAFRHKDMSGPGRLENGAEVEDWVRAERSMNSKPKRLK